MGGQKIGYGHFKYVRKGDRIHTYSIQKMLIGRVDQPVEINMTQRTTEMINGVPISFEGELVASLFNTSTRGKIANGKVEIVSSQFGMEQRKTYDFPDGAVMVWGLYRESLLRGFKPGTTYTIATYTPELRPDGAIETITTIGDWEQVMIKNNIVQGQRVTVQMNLPMASMEMISWVDQNGSPIKMKVPMPGLGDMEMIVTDQKSAMEDFVPPEMFMTTTIKANRKINSRSAQLIRYRIRPKNHTDKLVNELKQMPAGGMQSVTVKDDGSVIVTLTRQPHEKSPNPTAPIDPANMSDYLDSNLMMNIDDPELIKLAQKAAGKEKNLYKLGDQLRKFVTDYIQTKNLNIGFATASEVCRTREGDCSEHGVLLAALGRLHGLPSRVVVGLAYVPIFGGQNDIFGYHMWTQFHIDGRWVDFDAALQESSCSPTRIAFATSSLKNVGLADLSLPLISKIGAIDIDIFEIQESRRP